MKEFFRKEFLPLDEKIVMRSTDPFSGKPNDTVTTKREKLRIFIFGILMFSSLFSFLIYALVAYWDYIPYVFR